MVRMADDMSSCEGPGEVVTGAHRTCGGDLAVSWCRLHVGVVFCGVAGPWRAGAGSVAAAWVAGAGGSAGAELGALGIGAASD
eukprot:1594079-Amphidinium_carterae.1